MIGWLRRRLGWSTGLVLEELETRLEGEIDEGSRVEGNRYIAESGLAMARAATETKDAGLTGLEFGLAIPGTVGGFVRMNGGAYGREVCDILVSATLVLRDGVRWHQHAPLPAHLVLR